MPDPTPWLTPAGLGMLLGGLLAWLRGSVVRERLERQVKELRQADSDKEARVRILEAWVAKREGYMEAQKNGRK